MATSPIVAFYQETGSDARRRSLAQLQAQSLWELEVTHDFIQWLFPLDQPSSANPDAPILTARDIRSFLDSPELRARLLRSLVTMLTFYGLQLEGTAESPQVVRADPFGDRAAEWLNPGNHNFLRLTRILRSLTLLGCGPYAQALLTCLEGIYAENARVIGDATIRFWRNAVQRKG